MNNLKIFVAQHQYDTRTYVRRLRHRGLNMRGRNIEFTMAWAFVLVVAVGFRPVLLPST